MYLPVRTVKSQSAIQSCGGFGTTTDDNVAIQGEGSAARLGFRQPEELLIALSRDNETILSVSEDRRGGERGPRAGELVSHIELINRSRL